MLFLKLIISILLILIIRITVLVVGWRCGVDDEGMNRRMVFV